MKYLFRIRFHQEGLPDLLQRVSLKSFDKAEICDGFASTLHRGAAMTQQSCTASVSTALIGANTLFREGLKCVLEGTRYQACKVVETLDSIEPSAIVDVFIFTIYSDTNNLITRIRNLKEHRPKARVVVINGAAHAETVWALLDAGADGYLCSNSSPEAALASFDVVMLGGIVVPPFQKDVQRDPESVVSADAPQLDSDRQCKKLSDRETKILLCLMKGDSNKQIGRKFDIAEATVKVHLKAILRKIRVSNRTQAAVWAHHNKIGSSPSPVDPPGAEGTHDAPSSVDTPMASRLGSVQQGLLVAADQRAASALAPPRRIVRNTI
jgi:two-component system nitrate/nitrite response regulator NarL